MTAKLWVVLRRLAALRRCLATLRVGLCLSVATMMGLTFARLKALLVARSADSPSLAALKTFDTFA